MSSTLPCLRAAVDVRGARRIYHSANAVPVVALDDVDVVIESGRFVSVIGPSGCGKSTLLRLIAGLEKPDAGEIVVSGVTPREAASAKMLGLVPQTPALLPWLSLLDNVTLPHKVNRFAGNRRSQVDRGIGPRWGRRAANVEELLEKAGLGHAKRKLPSQISGGMQQRAAIVRALGIQPDLLLMDEPFSALDEFTRENLQEILLDMWDELQSTVVFVTHSISEAVRLSDTVIVMAPNPGRIVDIIDIDLPRPRGESLMKSADFHRYEDLVRDRLRAATGASVVTGEEVE